MPGRQLQALLRRLQRHVHPPAQGGLADDQLLDRWLALRDEAAFEVLLWRHAPMVLGVCERLLRHSHDAEDAFQATFLTLVLKARTIRKREGVGSWLYKVAYRVALRARMTQARHNKACEPSLSEVPVAESGPDHDWRDLRPVLDEELNRLPARCRAAFVLCYLQGRTNAEAARALGCPEGTIASRLASARERLRLRLLRRGITLESSGFAICLAEQALSPEARVLLVRNALSAALDFAQGKLLGGLVSPGALSLTKGVLRIMFLKRIALTMLGILLVSLVAGGLSYGLLAREQPPAESTSEPERQAQKPAQAGDCATIVSEQEGIVIFLGTPLNAGMNVPASRVGTAIVNGKPLKYRKLKVGDTVEEGQVLGQLDDRFARVEVEIKEAKVAAARADLDSSEKTGQEARVRYETQLRLYNNNIRGNTSLEDMRGAKLSWDRYTSEATSKKQAVIVAQLELKQARTILESYEIRSRVRGVIRVIYKHPGEAVHKLEAVFTVELPKE
ncbi:MAG TPA: sigma-70 family RNA polymerase sigma factor [Gemmataceae bacterium]|nr:sigma-70 family RNA polymerase sigma factor [Gemmataceae bacterium]